MSAIQCQEAFNSLLEYACSTEFKAEMDTARELFFIATGKVNDDDPFYDARMAAFQEFFLFEFRLSDVFPGATVFETFLVNAQTRLAPAQLGPFESFRSQRHSLFVVLSHRSDLLVVQDLFAREKFACRPLPDFLFAGFEQNQIFDGRLVHFGSENFFTGAFIFHPVDVRPLVERYVKDFLRGEQHCEAAQDTDWKSELARRRELLSSVSEQRKQVERSERKRAIDMLNVAKHLNTVPRQVSSPHLVMAIGRPWPVSPFVPETPFYDPLPLLQQLAYCELRSFRFRHIDPIKVYALDPEAVKSVPPASAPPASSGSSSQAPRKMVGEGA